MPRFFADGVKDGVIKITGEDAGHIFRVLRGKPGDTLTVCDGRGTDYEARIAKVASRRRLGLGRADSVPVLQPSYWARNREQD